MIPCLVLFLRYHNVIYYSLASLSTVSDALHPLPAQTALPSVHCMPINKTCTITNKLLELLLVNGGCPHTVPHWLFDSGLFSWCIFHLLMNGKLLSNLDWVDYLILTENWIRTIFTLSTIVQLSCNHMKDLVCLPMSNSIVTYPAYLAWFAQHLKRHLLLQTIKSQYMCKWIALTTDILKLLSSEQSLRQQKLPYQNWSGTTPNPWRYSDTKDTWMVSKANCLTCSCGLNFRTTHPKQKKPRGI